MKRMNVSVTMDTEFCYIGYKLFRVFEIKIGGPILKCEYIQLHK